MQKQLYRIFIIVGCVLTTTLSGCKLPIPSEVGEALANLGARFSIRAIIEKWDKNQNSELPFQLKSSESYEKVKTQQDEFYVVHRLNNVTEHYSLDGKLRWSSATPVTPPLNLEEEVSALNWNDVTLSSLDDNQLYPELNFPDFSAPGYRKYTDPELLQQIDAEYHAGMNLSSNPKDHGLKPISSAPEIIKGISTFMHDNGPKFVNQAFGRPNVSDVTLSFDGWLELDENEILYRAVIDSARFQCTWYQAVVNTLTGQLIYEEFMPCFAAGEENLDAI
ncbi:hypothetical protein ABTO87_06425 [Acinetobacter baumannii]